MHVVKHTFIPSFWRNSDNSYYWLNRNMHAPPVSIKLISIICLKLQLNELLFQSQYLILNCRANLQHPLYPTTNIAIRDMDHISPISVKHYRAVQPFGKWLIIANSETLLELWKFASINISDNIGQIPSRILSLFSNDILHK